AQVIAFMLPEKLMWSPRFGEVGLREYWFERRQIEFSWVGSAKWLRERARDYSDKSLSPWVVYQTSRLDAETVAELEGAMAEQGYEACQRVSLPVSTEMARYRWVALDCQPPLVLMSGHVGPMRYDFYGAGLAEDESKLYFANRLTAESEVSTGRLNISHQLVSEAWKNVGQLDMPLTAAGDQRQFSMDVSQISPGRYRLMAIVYDPATGKPLDWRENSGEPPSMLFLQEVEIR
ncbi:MAG: hypothetical protein OXI30_16360, partial [Chloroflexota bacterium]|nr:hypothetical protein [Chloroflexota bacterium]